MFWTNLSSFQTFYETPNFNLVILTKKFEGDLAFIWPFKIFQYFAFFETACGQIWPFLFFGTWQPCHIVSIDIDVALKHLSSVVASCQIITGISAWNPALSAYICRI
jgi:hypothetical protein